MKSKFISKPFNLLLFAATMLFIVSLFVSDETANLHYNDAYYVLSLKMICLCGVVFLGFFWFLYRATNNFLYSRILTWLHVIITVAAIFLFLSALQSNTAHRPTRYIDIVGVDTIDHTYVTSIIIVICAFIIAQFIYMLNILFGLSSKSMLE
ncbi:hypothetical protein [Pinibacter soli]|uniref:Uncharacterized protein n=1 Tax=Pinibacter soli TaxID=3044211 RepID=A0ABT6RI16_9BACT|nr:hypothetical protein [Pinibacter soli]MDI3322020.1 hypothetical protein [Pinibacter soli]